MRLKIRCDEKSKKNFANFFRTKQGLGVFIHRNTGDSVWFSADIPRGRKRPPASGRTVVRNIAMGGLMGL